MILTGAKIADEVAAGNITITPFSQECLTTNSYDFHLGDTLLVYSKKTLDVKRPNPTKSILLNNEGYVLQPHKIYLGHTVEIIGSNSYVPIIRGKSSTGRIGLFVHITADLIDIGSTNQYTLMLHATQPVRIYPGMQIGQVTFWQTLGEITRFYEGKYNKLEGPQASQVYRDFYSEDDNRLG